jgi:hypothetical protein
VNLRSGHRSERSNACSEKALSKEGLKPNVSGRWSLQSMRHVGEGNGLVEFCNVPSLIAAIQRMERRKDCGRLRTGHTIIDGLGGAPSAHEAVTAQPRKMLGQGRLTEADLLDQIAHRSLTFKQGAKDHQAVFVSQGFQ